MSVLGEGTSERPSVSYDFESSAAFKAKLDEIRGRQKAMVREKEAAVCETE